MMNPSSVVKSLFGKVGELSNQATIIFMSLDRYGLGTTRGTFITKYLADVAKDSAATLLRDLSNQVGAPSEVTRLIEAGAAVAEFISALSQKTADYYKFRINPSRLSCSASKVQSTIKTAKGWDIHTWGNNLDVLSYSGTTGYMKPPAILISMGIKDVRLSPAWQRFNKFDDFFHQNDGELVMIFEHVLMKVHMVDFRYDRIAEDPWQIKYSFSLRCDWDTKINMLTGIVKNFFTEQADLFSKFKGKLGSVSLS